MKSKSVNPILGGIGCILALGVPTVSYFISIYLIQENVVNKWVVIPGDMYAKGTDPLIYIKSFLVIICIMVISFLLMVITALINKFLKTSKKGQYDIDQTMFPGRKTKG